MCHGYHPGRPAEAVHLVGCGRGSRSCRIPSFPGGPGDSRKLDGFRGGTPALQAWPGPDGLRIEETCSDTLDPAAYYTISVQLASVGKPPSRLERVFRLPVGFSPFILFTPDGRLIDAGAYDDPLPPADGYLVLVRESGWKSSTPAWVEVAEEITSFPMAGKAGKGSASGWARGVGRTLRSGGQHVALLGSRRPTRLRVEFDHILPVWLSGCPRIRLAEPDRFADAVLEVEGGGLRTPVQLGVGTDVPVARTGMASTSILQPHCLDGCAERSPWAAVCPPHHWSCCPVCISSGLVPWSSRTPRILRHGTMRPL